MGAHLEAGRPERLEGEGAARHQRIPRWSSQGSGDEVVPRWTGGSEVDDVTRRPYGVASLRSGRANCLPPRRTFGWDSYLGWKTEGGGGAISARRVEAPS